MSESEFAEFENLQKQNKNKITIHLSFSFHSGNSQILQILIQTKINPVNPLIRSILFKYFDALHFYNRQPLCHCFKHILAFWRENTINTIFAGGQIYKGF
ncbi:hypothetical protein BGP_3187 [Beggiatoa sp. PS]|nr:hypothetical protein BGP_3187 [Beggiatoa sp. PS]